MKPSSSPPNRIRQHRLAKDWTQKELAKRAKTDASVITRLEKGQIPLSVEWINILCPIFDISAADLVDLPTSSKFGRDHDDALLGMVLGWLMEAADKRHVKLSRQQLGKWASFAYKEAVTEKLNFKQTQQLAVTIIKVIAAY